jgi:hypothetical protein
LSRSTGWKCWLEGKDEFVVRMVEADVVRMVKADKYRNASEAMR